MMKRILCVVMTLMMLVGCTAAPDEKMLDEGSAQTEQETSEQNPWEIKKALYREQECRVEVKKPDGGQATGILCCIVIPLEADADKTAVPLSLTLAKGAEISAEDDCIVSVDGADIVVDLTGQDPHITVCNKGHCRVYDLYQEADF